MTTNPITIADLHRLREPSTGRRLAYLRDRRGMNQGELGRRCGVSQPAISHLERSPGDAKFGLIEQACEALGITIPELVGDKFIDLHVDDRHDLKIDTLVALAGA